MSSCSAILTSSTLFSPVGEHPSCAYDYSSPEEDVFVTVNLPINQETPTSSVTGDSSLEAAPVTTSSAGGCGGIVGGNYNSSHYPTTATSPTHVQRINYQHRPTRPPPALPPDNSGGGEAKEDSNNGTSPHKFNDKDDGSGNFEVYPYVQISLKRPSLPPTSSGQGQPPFNHDYYYPVIDVKKPDDSKEKRDSIASIKKANQQQQEQFGISTTRSSGGGGIGGNYMGGMGKRNSNNRTGSAGDSTNIGIGKSKFGNVIKKSTTDGKPYKTRSGLGGSLSLKQRCRHCHDSFYPDSNPKGSCEDAPDLFKSAIDKLTCIRCAQCMLYHCMSDDEGEFVRHPCSCSDCCEPSCCSCCCCSCRDRGGSSLLCCFASTESNDSVCTGNEMMGMGGGSGIGVGAGSTAMGRGSENGECGKRWFGLTLLSLLVPCLWCYPPLKGCHSACVACGLCGGRHEAMSGRHGEGKYISKHMEGKLGGPRGSRYGGRLSGGSGRFDVGGS